VPGVFGFPAGVSHSETIAERRNREPENAEQKLGGRAEALAPPMKSGIGTGFRKVSTPPKSQFHVMSLTLYFPLMPFSLDQS
jgi:hypothetical protein